MEAVGGLLPVDGQHPGNEERSVLEGSVLQGVAGTQGGVEGGGREEGTARRQQQAHTVL